MPQSISEESASGNKHQMFYLASLCSANCFAVETLLFPVETVKCRIQNDRKNFSSFLGTIKNLYTNEGIKGFYRGYSTLPLSTIVSNVLWFYTYENFNKFQAMYCKDYLENEKTRNFYYSMIPFISGMFSEISCVFWYTPFQLIRTRMQIGGEYQYKSMAEGFNRIYRHEGFLRFYKASYLLIMSNILQTGFQFWTYENIRKEVKKIKNVERLSFLDSILVCGTSASIIGSLTNPLDLVITRFQMKNTEHERLSCRQIFWSLLKKEGLQGLMKGSSARTFSYFVWMSCSLPIYDHLRDRYGFQLY